MLGLDEFYVFVYVVKGVYQVVDVVVGIVVDLLDILFVQLLQ